MIALHTIGQTPRPDLLASLPTLFDSVEVRVLGALDGMDASDVPAPVPGGYPLETRMGDGSRIVLDAAFLEPRLQALIAGIDGQVDAHLVLCSGPFPDLHAGQRLIRPFDVGAERLASRGVHALEVVVPFAAQGPPAACKWEAAGFAARVHAVDRKPAGTGVGEWLAARQEASSAGAVVIDYVGFPTSVLEEVRAALPLPVLDLGSHAVEVLLAGQPPGPRRRSGLQGA